MSVVFSVITITYNAAPVLQRTLDSVARQTYKGVEHIIVDGASKDETVAMAEKYKEQSDQADNGHEVRILSEPDKGLYDAMNKGLRLATGDYIVYMNAGDIFALPKTLAMAAHAAETAADGQKPAVLYGDTDIVDGEGRFLRHRRLHPSGKLTWRSFRHGMLVCHQSFYARLDIARKTPYDTHFRYSADVDWCIRIMKKAAERGQLLAPIPAVTTFYMEEGQTTLHHKASLRERFEVMRRHYGLLTTVAMHAWFVLRKIMGGKN